MSFKGDFHSILSFKGDFHKATLESGFARAGQADGILDGDPEGPLPAQGAARVELLKVLRHQRVPFSRQNQLNGMRCIEDPALRVTGGKGGQCAHKWKVNSALATPAAPSESERTVTR